MLVTLERRVQILAISNLFDAATSKLSPRRPESERPSGSTKETQINQLMLSTQDLLGLIHTLYPKASSPEMSTEPSTIAVESAPPSTTSSSTLRPGSSEIGSCASSMVPNRSGSSVNSEATITGNTFPPPRTTVDSENAQLSARVISDVDPNGIASLLWSIYAKLQAATRTETYNVIELSRPSHWALLRIQANGQVTSVSPVLPCQHSLEEGTHRPPRPSSDYETLKQAITTLLASSNSRPSSNPGDNRSPGTVQDSLRQLLEEALASSKLSMDFLMAHHWHRCLTIYSNFATASVSRDFVPDLLRDISRQLQRSIEDHTTHAHNSESMIRFLTVLEKQQKDSLSTFGNQRKALRIKMWYVSDVRNSSTYEEALLVTKALRAMSGAKRSKQAGSSYSWARQRLRGMQSQERAEAQTLEAMTAPKDLGGISKLSDDQVEMTSRWLTRTGIENFCRGEERVHRFCYEVQKSIGKLSGVSLLDSPVLWSSHLFRREKATLDVRRVDTDLRTSMTSFGHIGSAGTSASGMSGPPPRSSSVSVSPHASGLAYSLGYPFAGQSTGATPSISGIQRSTMPLSHSPNMNEKTAPTGSQYVKGRNGDQSSSQAILVAKAGFIKNIKDSLYGLLTSDLGYTLWANGSETDAWVNQALLRGQLGEKSVLENIRSPPTSETGEPQRDDRNEMSARIVSELHDRQEPQNLTTQVDKTGFSFSKAYGTLLHRMSTTHDPFIKLEKLWQLESLVILSVQDSSSSNMGIETSTHTDADNHNAEPMTRSKTVPRTKTTSLEEVIANCTERRAGTLRDHPGLNAIASTDAIVNQLLAIFRDPQLRPPNLFLSLQYIASFIPSHTLDHTSHGKAFWDCALAALALKEDQCNNTVSLAAEITNAHVTTTTTTRLTSPPSPSQQEAANLWLISAKEGSPVAARELGLFYLTHPDLLPQRVTMPLSKTKNVFKSVNIKSNDGFAACDDKERGALDPLTFDVVYHWMEIAANGGDAEAKAFLRQSGSG